MQRISQSLWILFVSLCSTAGAAAQDGGLAKDILDIQHQWEHIHYQIPEDKQDAAYPQLEENVDALIKRYPGRAEPLVWKAIVLSTHAGAKGGLSALGMVRRARDLLEQAEKIDPNTLNGSIYTTLGSLYYQVPGWPLGYGDDKKAEILLKKALQINPDGMDANYFYGDFLYRTGRYSEALSVLEKAMHAPDRPNRPLADEGRRKEIQAVIAKIKDKT
jgi:tetratricopeptide (TPR) repeat protein